VFSHQQFCLTQWHAAITKQTCVANQLIATSHHVSHYSLQVSKPYVLQHILFPSHCFEVWASACFTSFFLSQLSTVSLFCLREWTQPCSSYLINMLCNVCTSMDIDAVAFKEGVRHHASLEDLSAAAQAGCELCTFLHSIHLSGAQSHRVMTWNGPINPESFPDAQIVWKVTDNGRGRHVFPFSKVCT